MAQDSPPLTGLSPVAKKPVVVDFDGAEMSSDAGLMVLREVERRMGLAVLLGGCLEDPRDPTRVRHSLAEIIRFRIMMIAAGYEDGNDAGFLREDPVFKMALDRAPEAEALCSQPTISRLENLPDAQALIRIGQRLVDHYCASFPKPPAQIVLDIDDTFDAVHGHQQLRLFNSYYDEYGFQPIIAFDGEGRFVGVLLRPARRPKGRECAAHIRRLIRQIRRYWPATKILLRADSHYAAPEVLDLCEKLGLRYIFGLSKNPVLNAEVASLEAATALRHAAKAGTKLRRFKTFSYPARSWSRSRRVIARVEVGPRGRDTRYIVTNLEDGRGKHLYEKLYSARGQAENHIKSWKAHLAADRTSCSRATANQMRLFLHAGAYWLLWALRATFPRRSPWRQAQFDTLRLRLLKLAASVVEVKTRIRITLPAACPAQPMLRYLIGKVAAATPT